MSIPSASVLVKDVVNLLHKKGEKYSRTAASDEINGLVLELSLLQKLVEEIDKEQRIHDWLTEVEKTCYDAEDLVFENQSKNADFLSLGAIKRWFFSDVDDDFLGQISLLRKKIRHLLGVGEHLSQGQQNNRPPLPSGSRQKKDSIAVGLVNELDFLLNWILESKSDSFSPNVISVMGIRGLGKTTLVRRLYNHGSLRHHFETFAWVSLGTSAQRDFDQLWGALGSILKQLVPATNEMLRNSSIMGIAVNIRNLLAFAKCLVVIDDLWLLDYLDWLSSFLGIRETASKLVATTRFQELATSNPSIELFKLRHLTEEESLELLVRRVCVNIPEDPQLYGVVEFIVKRCKGIPLAINVLGSLLATKQTSGEWKATLRAMELCNVHQEDSLQQLELEILSLCYDDMPHHLKLCFLYLGLFSEQPSIEVETLYQLWMAEGFVQPNNEESAITMMDAAEQYLDELATRGFVEVNEAEVPNIRRFKSCRLHSMMLDLCLHKAKQEIFSEVIRSCQRNEINKSLTPFGNIRRLCMNVGGGYQSEDVMAVLLKNADMHLGYLRSLLLLKLPRLLEFVKFSESINLKLFLLLRVLRFDGFDLRESKFVGEIGKLTSLRYLSVRDCRLNNLPLSLGELLNLQTLDLRVAIDRMVTIPNIIWKLKRLRHLYLPSKFNAREDDKLRLDSLVNLETLENFDTSACSTTDLLFLTSLRNLTASVKGNAKFLQGIIKRINMNQNCLCQTSIRVRRFDAFTAEERDLSMSQLLECPSLHTLQIKGCMSMLPHIISCSLTRIVLSRSALVNDPMATLGRFPNLWDLVLEDRAFLGKRLTFASGGFGQLKHLTLSNLPKLEFLIEEEGSMPNLCTLQVEGCNNLKELPIRLQELQGKNSLQPSMLKLHPREGAPTLYWST